MANSPIISLVRNNVQVAEQLKVQQIKAVALSIESGKKKVFTKSIELARLLVNAKDWMKSNDTLVKDKGITWKSILMDVFGFTESAIDSKWPNQLVKVGVVTDDQLTEFIQWATKNNQPLSIKSLDSWLKGSTTEETAEGGEEEGGAEGTKGQCVACLTFKLPLIEAGDKNVSVSLDTNGNVKTSNNEAELRLALELLTKALGLV